MHYTHRPTVGELTTGDRVLFGDRREPLTVTDVDDVTEREGTIRIRSRAELEGPRGGRVILEGTSTGRTRAKVGQASWSPAYTVDDLQVVT
ncbi:hypothetical protein [Natronosalvus rutilus]|uniref:Uncharacterized protein n=1 Tax=Natronosalvus rutilus TaxID=2953753 RepID=A0A9E7NFU5_9EURY|nr:hypothetical protein [Natronosalvus rutilus]UTF56017.1 hypothetical protein NGM29_20740 [Natronosalvus rutilus]